MVIKKYKDKNCAKCDKTFRVEDSPRQKYCKNCLTFNCLVCGATYKTRPAEMEVTKYCSRSCQNKVIRLGSHTRHTPETKLKISRAKTGVAIWNGHRETPWMVGSKNRGWMGDRVGYDALHDWVNRQKGKATKCLVCSRSTARVKGFDWANLDKKYRRNQGDFVNLCQSCHKRWDLGKMPINLYEWRDLTWA